MRTVTRLASTLLLSLAIASCGDDSPSGPGGDNTMTAKINGSSWTGTLAVQGSHNSNVLQFGGTDGQARQILINLLNVTTTGTYPLGAGELNVATVTFVAQAWTSTLTGGGGSVVVTSLDDEGAAGTFTITAVPSENTGATGTKTITNGTFNIKF